MGIRRVAGLTRTWLLLELITVLDSACLVWTSLAAWLTECTWSLKFLDSFRIRTQLRKRLQRVFFAVDGTTHTQKDGVESNGGSLKDGAEAFMLFLCGAQLVLRSSVRTVHDLGEVDVTLKNAEIFGSVLYGKDGFTDGWWCFRGSPGCLLSICPLLLWSILLVTLRY